VFVNSVLTLSSFIQFLSVQIYVEDSRVVPTHKTVAMLSLPVLNRTNGAIRIYARDIIAALQRSNGAIEIPSTGTNCRSVYLKCSLVCRLRTRHDLFP
jgi:hypothetical protein